MIVIVVLIIIYFIWLSNSKKTNKIKSNYDECSKMIHNSFDYGIKESLPNIDKQDVFLQGVLIIDKLNFISKSLKNNKLKIANQINISTDEVEEIINRKYKEFLKTYIKT